MRIKSIDSFVVQIPSDADRLISEPVINKAALESQHDDPTTHYPPRWRTMALSKDASETVIVRIETDNHIIGWGEIHTPVAAQISKTVIDHLLGPLIYNEDPRDIHPLWEKMYATMRIHGQMAGYQLEAISGIDIALWDIVGKAVNAPIAKLLGGKIRDRVPVYASRVNVQPVSDTNDGSQFVEEATALVEQGCRALKITLGNHIDYDKAVLERIRNAVGDQIKIAVSANAAYDLALARQVGKMLESQNVLWLEDPLAPENLRDYARLAQFLDVTVAGGRSLHNRWQFNDYLSNAALDLVQPCVTRAGGLSECRRIAMLADTYGIPFAPSLGTCTAIAMAASLQWAASGTSLMICEWPIDQERARNKIVKDAFAVMDGYVNLDDEPGLGIHVDETALMKWVI